MIRTRDDLKAYLSADLAANGLQRWRFRDRFVNRLVYFQRLLRYAEYWTNTARTPVRHLIAIWFRLRLKILGERLSVVTPRNVFGPGLSIVQPGAIFVHYRARVGANCRLHQAVTIGEANGKIPVIGDDVCIYPRGQVIGADVGNRVTIHAAAVVTRQVPDDAEVAGVPARIVRLSTSAPS